MKKITTYLSLILAITICYSCKKGDTTTTPVAATSSFTLNGNTYIETVGVDSVSTKAVPNKTLNFLSVAGTTADGKATAAVQLIFLGAAKPAAGTYTVVADVTVLSAGQVAILALDKVTIAKQGIYGATAKDNAKLTITVSASGKVNVAFPTVALSGSNFDGTDTKNTVITTVNCTLAGSIAEQ